MSTPVEQALVDKVAQAICGVEDRDPIPWDELSDYGKEQYRKKALAAIEALQLTEEWTWSWSETLTLDGKPGYGFSVSSREEAEAEADSYMTIVSRLVGPWRTA